MQKNLRIWTKIFFIVLIALVPTLVITVYSVTSARYASISKKEQFLDNLCEGFINEQRLICRSAKELLQAVSQTRAVGRADYATLDVYFKSLMKIYPDYAVLLAADEAGSVVASGVGKTGYSLSDREYFSDALRRREFTASSFLYSKSTGAPSIIYSLPAEIASGASLVLIAAYDLSYYNTELSLQRIPDDGTILEIFDAHGRRLFSSSGMNSDKPGDFVLSELQALSSIGERAKTRTIQIGGEKYLASSQTLSDSGQKFTVTVRIPYDVVLYEAGVPIARVLILMLFACIAAFAVCIQMARRLFVDRIIRLTEFSKSLADGDLAVRSGMNRAHDEITDLMIAFNRMAASLEDRTRDSERILEEKENLLLELKKRVADNLQLLSSIVHLQQIHATDEPVKKALQTTHSRIMALSMVYETLFRFSDVESIVMQEYCTGLCDYLVSLYSEIGSKVQCSVSGIDISLSIERALPLALVINELVSNSLLHAFGIGDEGFIDIEFLDAAQGMAVLSIIDNGRGFDESVRKGDSLGYEMIEALVSQLNGSLLIDRCDSGSRVRVFFPLA